MKSMILIVAFAFASAAQAQVEKGDVHIAVGDPANDFGHDGLGLEVDGQPISLGEQLEREHRDGRPPRGRRRSAAGPPTKPSRAPQQ